jgi:N12 class adenine-specific DNA methylase
MDKLSKRQNYHQLIWMLQCLAERKSIPASSITFTGFGQLKELLLPVNDTNAWNLIDRQYRNEVEQVHQGVRTCFPDRYKEVMEAIKNSILTSFYTPSMVTVPLTHALAKNYPNIKDILEPAAGIGNFITPLKEQFPMATITAIEKDPVTHELLSLLHPEITTFAGGYENFKTTPHDLIISNIPFGNVRVYDEAIFREAAPVKVKATTRIHNYFFVKSLDNLKTGGLLAFITSNALLDTPGNREVREYLFRHADLVTAIRMPNNIFESAGTRPVTDIIVLRRNNNKRNLSDQERSATETTTIRVPDAHGLSVEININTFIKNNPQLTLGTLAAGGQYMGNALDVLPTTDFSAITFEQQLITILDQALHHQREEKATSQLEVQRETPTETEATTIPPNHPNVNHLLRGNLIVLKGKVGSVEVAHDQKKFKPEPAIKDVERTLLFIDLRTTLHNLVQAELEADQQAMQTLRSALNQQYDLFTFRYGNLNHPANKKLLLFDAEGFKVLALEHKTGDRYVKADIFSRQVNNTTTHLQTTASLKDAILLSLNVCNKADLDFIAQSMGQDKQTLMRQALDEQLLFWEITTGQVVPKDQFLSGNIVKKLEAWEAVQETDQTIPQVPGWTSKDTAMHLEELRKVRPLYLKRELIDINLGERWIPIDLYEGFAKKLFQQDTEIKYLESTDLYLVNVKGYSTQEDITYAATTYNGKISGNKTMEYAMADTIPQLRKRIPGTDPPQYVADTDGMKSVETKVREIKEAFEDYLINTPEATQTIESLYNRNINNSVRRNYDGSHLQLPQLEHFTPRSHQKDAVWMLLQQEGGIVDHQVGAGKTLVIVATAMEMRRLGLAKKPLILCMKANVADVARDFLKAYPNARLLAPDPLKDFTKQNRQRIFSSIMANEWDAVIITHDMFMAIPQSAEIKKEILEQELKNLNADLAVISQSRILSKRVLKGLESRKQNLTVKLMLTEAAIERDQNILDFDKMGFDHIFVDESQEFKNLHFTTRHQQVAGLGDPAGSQRALNLEMAIRTIQKKKGADRGATFLSGTTISNSLVELYLLFKYLRPNKLNHQNINSFDAWAKMYARKSATYEFSVTNELKMKERFREFIKVPELARFYAEITHVANDRNLKIQKPVVENIVINLEPTPEQAAYTERLINFTRTKNPAYVDLTLSEKEMQAFMLIATNLAKKMSIDMRLINPHHYDLEADGKIDTLCRKVSEEYTDSHTYKGTQLIFSDIGTPTGSGFNLYEEIKRVLVDRYDIPPEQIQFIHQHDTRKKKEKLFAEVNNGAVRILLGSTKKLGTGVNVQQRVIAMHHLDIPWRPADFEQRVGRGGRQGNHAAQEHRQNVVRNYVYAVNRTLDAYQFNILSNKQKFISQIKDSSIDQRKIDEGAFDQDGGMNFGEYVALLSGNTDLLEKVRMEKKLADLERGYQLFLQRKAEAEHQVNRLTRDSETKRQACEKIQADWQPLENLDIEALPIQIERLVYTDKKEAGERLHQQVNALRKQNTTFTAAIATMSNFQLMFDPIAGRVHVLGPSGMIYNYADGKLNESPALAGRFMTDTLKRIPKALQATQDTLVTMRQKIETYRMEQSTTFKDKEQIITLKQQIEKLAEKLQQAFNPTPELNNENTSQITAQEAQVHLRAPLVRRYR